MKLRAIILTLLLSGCTAGLPELTLNNKVSTVKIGSTATQVRQRMGIRKLHVYTDIDPKRWKRLSFAPYPVGADYYYRYSHPSLTYNHKTSYFVFDKNDRLIHKEVK